MTVRSHRCTPAPSTNNRITNGANANIMITVPRKEFHRYLRGMVEAGYGKRIMFGSNASMWPQVIGIGIEAIESADFLSEAQKRDLLYNNAVRFLRLGEKDGK